MNQQRMSCNRKGNNDGSDSSQYDEEAEYIKANKALDRKNKWLDERCGELEKKK